MWHRENKQQREKKQQLSVGSSAAAASSTPDKKSQHRGLEGMLDPFGGLVGGKQANNDKEQDSTG